MSKATKSLIKLIEKSASEQNSCDQAQQLIKEGADITVPTSYGPMIHTVIAEEKRQRLTLPAKADNCVRLIRLLEKTASTRLAAQVFSERDANLQEMRSLVGLRASCYQQETYGPLGLLGSLLSQDKVPIRIDVVKFLLENDLNAKNGLAIIGDQGKTYLSMSKTNAKCSKDVIDYIQQQFDEMLNQIPILLPNVNPNQVIAWIRAGANIEAVDKNGNTVLSNAVRANHLELVRTLISAGSNIAHKNHDDLMPLEIARKAVPKNPPLIAFLEEQNVNIDFKKMIETKQSRLTTDDIQGLLEKGANINASLADGDSPLHVLIGNHGTVDVVKAFINDFNADLSATNNRGYRALETCVLLDPKPCLYLQTILSLPKMTADKFRNPKLKKTLLQFAIEQKRSDAAKLIQDELNLRLWNSIAGVNTDENNNKTIMERVNELIAGGADINHSHTDQEYDKWTVLHLVTKIATAKMLQYLVTHLKADYTLQNSNGDYPISIAAQFGQLAVIEFLRDLPNFNINAPNNDMQTPLHLAAKNNHLLVVQYLVRWGADDQSQNKMKQTPLDIARENVSKNKDEQISIRKIIEFLSQLICPREYSRLNVPAAEKKPTYDLDVCDLPIPVVLNPINMSVDDADAALGNKSKGIFSSSPNNNLHDAARSGDIALAKKSIGEGADIRFRKGNHTPFEVARTSQNEYSTKSKTAVQTDVARFQAAATGCQQIMQMLQQIAQTKINEAIQQSNAGLVMAYHQAGAPITVDLLYKACNASDNVEIVDYLVRQSAEIYQAMINDPTPNAPYRIARAKRFDRVTAYAKYALTVECTKAVKENNLERVKRLVHAGASVDLNNTNNLNEAVKHQNLELIQLLCENGAKMPLEWLSRETIVLDPSISYQMKPEVVLFINRHLTERRLRFAAANGNLNEVIHCQRLCVNINARNCHGSTALLCTIQYGNYFPVVHALVSRGASMLHSNANVGMSLIDLVKQQNYEEITAYLSKELNAQFLSAILDNDRQSAEKFARMGADFNYKDEQERTPLHYAVQYHGIDLVSWLCECGSTPTVGDVNGDYPIMQAVEKGDYALVELFTKKYPATKKQTNKAGMTALQLAQKLKYNRIVQLIETGKAEPGSEKNEESKTSGPSHSEAALMQAARNGHMKIIREFIAERYESKEQKKKICQNLIQAAKKASQYEVAAVLEPYYKTELRTELASDMHAGSNIVLSERYKKVLLGLLGSLSNLIAESSILLDPADPNTYTQFFVGLTQQTAKRSEELQQVKTAQDVTQLIEKDQSETQEQLGKIQEKLEEILDGKNELEARLLDTDERLRQEQKLTALQRKEFMKEKQLHEQQLATYECSLFLFQRQQEAILNRQKAIDFLKRNMNLMLFYRIIENRLEALFHSCLAAQGGYVKVESATNVGKLGKAVNITAEIPIVGLVAKVTKGVVSSALSKLDGKQQKREWQNMSTFGNIEELRRIASETAGLITLYYNEQIQSIDPSQKIKGGNIFNDKVNWLNQIYDVRPENSEDMAIVLVAEYVTAWIIDGLKMGTEIDPTEPISQQLWLHVAKRDPTNEGKGNKTTDVLSVSAGQQKIQVKGMSKSSSNMPVQIRYLIGCVSVIGNDGSVYQYPVPPNPADVELRNLDIFGYVYTAPFSLDEKALQMIVEGRKLQFAKRDEQGKILTRFEDIIQHAQAFLNSRDQQASKSSITQETAMKVAEVLREKNMFVDAEAVRNELRAAQETIELSVEVLRDELREAKSYYQTSIDAAQEQIKQESETNRTTMKKDNEVRYEQAFKKLNEQFGEMEKRLETSIEKRMNDIEEQLRNAAKKISVIANTAKEQSTKAMTESQQATEISQQAVENSTKAASSAENVSKMAEERNEEFKLSTKNCEDTVRQAALSQKQLFERSILEIRTKTEKDIEKAREAVTKSATDTKESARSAKESESTVKDVQKMMKNEQEAHAAEMKKIIAEAKEIRQQSEKVTIEAKEAQKQAARAADTTAATVEKINAINTKVEKALEQMEKLTKKWLNSQATA